MNDKITVGWREWVSLPELSIPHIKAKIDTGARTSALHAFHLAHYTRRGVSRVRFSMHPYQKNIKEIVECDAEVCDYRLVSDSGGHREKRYVIQTTLQLGDLQWPVEMTLTNRETMKFRMLLGRTAMYGRMKVDPEKSYLVGKKVKHKTKK